MVLVFYVILAIFSVGLRNTSLPGLNVIQLLFLPIIIGIAGIGWGAYNFTFDEKEPWENGKKILFFILAGTVFLLLGQIALIIAGYDNVQEVAIRPSYLIVGDTLMILSCLVLAIGFFFLRKQLLQKYLKKIFIKNPNLFIVFSYLLQAVAYILFFTAYFTTQGNTQTILDVFGKQAAAYSLFFSAYFLNQVTTQMILDAIGIGIAVIALIFLLVGFIPVNISFRTYPHLVEDETLRK